MGSMSRYRSFDLSLQAEHTVRASDTSAQFVLPKLHSLNHPFSGQFVFCSAAPSTFGKAVTSPAHAKLKASDLAESKLSSDPVEFLAIFRHRPQTFIQSIVFEFIPSGFVPTESSLISGLGHTDSPITSPMLKSTVMRPLQPLCG